MQNKNSQAKQVELRLRRTGKITSLQAIELYGATRLSSIIYNLRHKKGMEIKNNYVKGTNRYGNPTHYVEYTYADYRKH